MNDTTEDELTNIILGERKFLHDISNFIVVTQGMTNIVLRALRNIEGLDEDIIKKQEKALKAVNEQVRMIKLRRTELHQRPTSKLI